MIKLIISYLSVFLPWSIKKFLLIHLLGYSISDKSRIGFSLILVKNLKMSEGARIRNFSVIKNLDNLIMKDYSSIGSLNWISGFPIIINPIHFYDQPNRIPQLLIGEHSAITNRHYIDCTDSIIIGKFSTIAGIRSQLLTHSINIDKGRQFSNPILVGDYVFIGTKCVLLPNSSIPNYSVLGAGSVLNKKYLEPYNLYAGVPARKVKPLNKNSNYFNRIVGYVY